MTAAVFAAAFAALYAAHQVGDHWVQTDHQAAAKGLPGWPGRVACAAHVGTLTATKAAFMLAAFAVTGIRVPWLFAAAGLALDAAAHYWADRRFTLARFARLLGSGKFWQLGIPRHGHDDNPSLGTGAYALDQSFHIAFLFASALIIAGGAR